jgi:glycosyltransferase involved in cell wall biosynthesis
VTTQDSLSAAAVIPTFNRREGLPRVLEPLFADPALAEIVVVVDGCRDGSIELLEKLAAEESRLKPLYIDNRGANAARLAGAEHAASDVIVLLDDDVIAKPGLVEGHIRHHESAAGLVVAGYLYMEERDWQPGGAIREAYRELYEKACVAWEREPASLLLGLWAGNLSFRRTELLRINETGPPLAKGYHVDLDLGLRCRKLGMNGVFDRRLVARHDYTRTLAGFIADARDSGASRVMVQAEQQDALALPNLDRYQENLPLPGRLLMRAARRAAASALISRLLVLTMRIAGLVRWPLLEFTAAKLLRRVEAQRGAIEAEASFSLRR